MMNHCYSGTPAGTGLPTAWSGRPAKFSSLPLIRPLRAILCAAILALRCAGSPTTAQAQQPGDIRGEDLVEHALAYLGQGQDEYGLYIRFMLRTGNFADRYWYLKDGSYASFQYAGNTTKYPMFEYRFSNDDDQGIFLKVRWGGVRLSLGDGNWSSFITVGNTQQHEWGGDGPIDQEIRWYVPPAQTGQHLIFSAHVIMGAPYVADRTSDTYSDTDSSGYDMPVFPRYFADLSTAISDEPGMIRVNYAYRGDIGNFGNYQYTMQHYMDGDIAHGHTENSGSFDLPMSNNESVHLLHTTATGMGNYFTYDMEPQPVLLPPYIWPDSLKAVYDGRDTVTLSWQVNTLPGVDVLDGDEFEVQRSTDADFAAQVVHIASFPYDPARETYTVEDNLANLAGGSRVYYRLRRTHSDGPWGWQIARRTAVDVRIGANLAADTVILDDLGPSAILRWEPFSGLWPAGSTLTLTKVNKTTGSVLETIHLTEEQARAGTYVDENIPYCNEVAYTLSLSLGNGYGHTPEIQVPGTVLAVRIGTIHDLRVSKGYFPDRVELRWAADGVFDNFLVLRRKYGSLDDFLQIANVAGGGTTNLVTEDTKGAPGIYYEYRVVGAVRCNNEVRYAHDTLKAVGFRSPTGVLSGRVTYENGQAVTGVTLRLEDQGDVALGQSIYLNGQAGSFLWLDSLRTPLEDSALTLQLWMRPDDPQPREQVIFSREGQYELGFDEQGRLYFRYGEHSVSAPYTGGQSAFVHLAAVHRGDTLSLLMNDSALAQATIPYAPVADPARQVYIGRNHAGHAFRGYLDEMSIWNRALSREELLRDGSRLLTGTEKGLAACWHFDETIAGEFYDLAHQDGDYHRNDGRMDPRYVSRSSIIPSAEQLSLKAYTDSTGNYLITGIPYVGDGTVYSIAALYGTHQFEPAIVNRFISDDSPAFTVNFTDKSSFPVSGYVYYRNSTVPVRGVQFKIDGQFAQAANGDLLETDAEGKFTISVPVGVHEVAAIKNNHILIHGGRITDRLGHNVNYQGPVSERILYDSTTVRFIGRVAGGAVQEAYPLGHSLSTNNLGKVLAITLELPSGNKYRLTGSAADSAVVVDHLLPGGADSAALHRSRVVWRQDRIIIYPDSLTGEFAADLLPEKFNATQVQATGWGDLLEGQALTLDLTNKFLSRSIPYTHRDSMPAADGQWTYQQFTDTVHYNDSYQFIKRVAPSVRITQMKNGLEPLAYFGDSIYHLQTLSGEQQDIPLVDNSQTGRDKYLFRYPVFTKGVSYALRITAFEEYPFYERVNADGSAVVARVEGHDVVDRVPTQDGRVTLHNTIRDGAAGVDTLALDSSGTAGYTFVAGDPATIPPGLKSFAATIRFGQAIDVSWDWLGQGPMNALVTGSRQTGTDFVTAGPDKLLLVLRDPPGNRSYSFAEQGTTITSSTTYSASVDNVNDATVVSHLGPKITTWQGVGAGTEEEDKVIADLGLSAHLESHYTHTSTKTSTTTLTTRLQTSAEPIYVGAPADLFVGYSTNITYGQSDNLAIIPRSGRQANDVLILDPGPSSDYIVVEREGIAFGEQFGTLFAYPQQHIETVLIPNLKKLRNSLLLPPTTSPASAQQAADAGNTEVYVSKLPLEDTAFGRSNNDTVAFGEAARTQPFYDGPSYTIYFPSSSDYQTDTIMAINQYIDGWLRALADNEKDKLNAEFFENYSFHAGNPITYAEQTSLSAFSSDAFQIIVSGSVLTKDGDELMGIGMEVKAQASIGTTESGDIGSGTETHSTLGFELAADGLGEYISADVGKVYETATSASGTEVKMMKGFSFRTKGGQTECPYEGGTLTKYYNEGTLLDQPTAQLDKPSITVDNPVVNNVPSTQRAAYTIHLDNASEAEWSTYFVLTYGNTDSVKGASIAVDGMSIASGRTFPVIYGERVTKVLTLQKGPDALDYNNIPIILHSACQYDPTGYQATIADTVFVSAHFVPSCSNVEIKAPSDNWVLNLNAAVNEQGQRYLPIILDQFDMSNALFDHLELQYKPSAASQWITVMRFYGDSAKFNEAEGDKTFISNAQEIHYALVMDDGNFPDQAYDIRAVAVCLLGPGRYANTPSAVIKGVKDTYAPRLFGSPEPGNGVLKPGNDIRLHFNEPIAAGLLTHSDFQVTGIRNGAPGDHSVSVRLDGQGQDIVSDFAKNFTAKDITVSLWVLNEGTGTCTLFSQGTPQASMELGFTGDDRLAITVGAHQITSQRPLDIHPGEWAHVALVYHAGDSTVSGFYNFEAVIPRAQVGAYASTGPLVFGRSIRQDGDYFQGRLHGARIWTEARTATELQAFSLRRLSGAEDALLAYYPMTEGHGDRIFDKAHGNHASLTGSWSTPPGKALLLPGDGYARIRTAAIPLTDKMDYTLGLWFKGEAGQTEATLASNGRGDGTDAGGSTALFWLGFDKGLLSFENNGFRVSVTGNYLDDRWHQVTLTVNRNSGTAQLWVDGLLKTYFDSRKLGGLAAPDLYLGVRAWKDKDSLNLMHYDRFFRGQLDEFRLWNSSLDPALIRDQSNTRLSGHELGLLAYYPFEKYFSFQHNSEMGFTAADQKIQDDTAYQVPDAVLIGAAESDDMAPIKDRGPVENLQFDYVVNDDELVINLLEPRQAVDKTVVTLSAGRVQDQHGNTLLSPISWTAFIDQNPLAWSDADLQLSKDLYAPLQFEAYIINSGGQEQHFRLGNLPAWLDASPMEGTLAPEGRVKVVFTVHEGLNVGRYDEIIYAHNDNDEDASLALNLTVKGQTPAWQVDPSAFRYTMTIYGQMRIAGVFSDDPEDMLAAFQNGRCVGVAHSAYLKDTRMWYVFLTVYGDSLQGGALEFRMWDASTGQVYQGLPPQPIAFRNDAVIGSTIAPVVFDGSLILYRDIPLLKGWNWISFALVSPDLGQVNRLLANGQWQTGDLIKHDERGFDSYSYTAGWVGTLPGVDNTSLYKLQTAHAQVLSTSGKAVKADSTPITVRGGRWNYISYLPPVNMTLTDALAGYAASVGDQIKSQTGFAMYDARNGWVGSLSYLEPGKGYMLYRQDAGNRTFTYPDREGSLSIYRQAVSPLADLNPLERPVDGNRLYADNMTLVAGVQGVRLEPGDELLAYAGTELRGRAAALPDPLSRDQVFFLNIAGDTSAPLRFEISRSGRHVATSRTALTFQADSRLGGLGAPLMLNFGRDSLKAGLSPNPFTDRVTLRIMLTGGPQAVHRINLAVYSVGGRLVRRLPGRQVSGPSFEASWDGRNSAGTACPAGVYFIRLLVDKQSGVFKVIKMNPE